MWPSLRRLNREGGFSLVEMVVASVILLFSVSIILNAFITGNIINKRASKIAIATNLARQKLELIKNKNFADIGNQDEADVGSDYQGYKWLVDMTFVQKNGDGTYSEVASDIGLKKVVVKVSWTGEGKREVEVSAIIANANLYGVQGGISGYVTDGTNGVADATVATSDGLYSGTTASDGSYSIDNIIVGTYTFYASKSGYATSFAKEITVAAETVTTGQNFTISASPGAISGTITHAASTQTIENATIITSPGGYSATSNASGEYTLSGVLSGDYTVTATASGYQYGQEYGVAVTGGSTTSGVDFELSPGALNTGTITGTIYAEDGSKIGGAEIEAEGTEEYEATSNNNPSDPAYGTYTIDNVFPGTSYTISAQASGYVEKQVAGKTVSAGEITPADFTLKQMEGTVKGQVTNNSENPVEGVMLTLSYSSLYDLTNSAGNYIIEHVPVGTYNLTASTTSPSKSQTVSIEVYNGLETVKNFNTGDFH